MELKTAGYWLRKREIDKREMDVVGHRLPQKDSKVKATGEAKFATDLKLPNMLHGKILRSPLPHARILNIDSSHALLLPGVKAIVTGKDTLGVKFGIWRLRPETMDQFALAVDKVHYVGEEVAAVAAIDEDTAEEALSMIKVDYEELPAVFDPEEAIKEGAPQIHDHVKNNIAAARSIEVGDVNKGFKEADYVREDRFVTQATQHVPVEPHACVASFDSLGKLTVWTSTQSPYFVQYLLAMTLGFRESDIRVIRPYVGGGFGSKFEMFANEFCASLLSVKTDAPVKIVYSREEEFAATRVRHPMVMDLKTGMKKDGAIVAVEFKNILDGGAANSMGVSTTMIAGICLILPYRIPNYRYMAYRAYTNKHIAGAQRGHSGLQPIFAFESQLDIIAEELGLDPLDVRLKNITCPDEVKIPGLVHVSSCGLAECVDRAAQSIGWREKRGKLPQGRGLGIGCYGYFSGELYNYFNTQLPFNEAWVRLNEDGTAHLFTLAADTGQGSDTVLCQIVAEELGIKFEDVSITSSNTQVVTGDLGNFSSRTTLMDGTAAQRAAADAKGQIFNTVACKLGLKVHDELDARGGRIFIKRTPEKGLSMAEAVAIAQRAKNGAPIMGHGIYTPRGLGTVVSPTWSFGAQAADVEVDKETGQTKVLKLSVAHDCGQAINPMSVEGQLEGSIHMSLGFALAEKVETEKGQILNANLTDYDFLTSLDMPLVDSIVVNTIDLNGPFGAKEAGEGLTVPTAAAIANAVSKAAGIRLKELPLTPDSIIQTLK